MVLFEKLRVLRKRTGLSQMELAEKLKVSRQAISNWEAGTARPSIDNIHYLSKLYNIPLEVLLDDDAGVEKVIKPTDFREEPQQVREDKDSKRKKVIGAVVTLITLVIIAAIIAVVLTETRKTTDISEIPGEEIELDSSGIELDW